MFSGIVEETALIKEFTGDDPIKLRVESQLEHGETKIGDSISIDGVCLTVVLIEPALKNGTLLDFELSQETIRCSTFYDRKVGDQVNLERSLKLGDRISGHLVFGHVDATIQLISRESEKGGERFTWELPEKYRGFVANKGSVSISGVSLTTADVEGLNFSTYIIPHTSSVTTLNSLKPGMYANFEMDMLARYVESLLSARKAADEEEVKPSGITEEFLRTHGYIP